MESGVSTYRLDPRLREARKVSQAALAQAVDCKLGRISQLELGYASATWAETEAIAAVLKVEPYWLANRPQLAPVLAPQPPPVVITPALAPVMAPKPLGEPSQWPVPVEIPKTHEGIVKEIGRGEQVLRDNIANKAFKPTDWCAWRGYLARLRQSCAQRAAEPMPPLLEARDGASRGNGRW